MRKIAAILASVLCVGVEATKSGGAKTSNDSVGAEQAILMDYATGYCIFEKNSEEKCVPSSMTKLMTLYVLFSTIASGRIKLEDELPVSKAAQKMKGSRSFFQAGTEVKVEDLIRSIIVHSGNDACTVIAEGIFGDMETFVEKMNEQAQKFGLKNTNFTNPSGLPDDEHFSCVYDIALVAKRIIADFPQFYHYFSEKAFTINAITQKNRNTLLGNALKVDGLKTGRTNSGGYGMAISAENNGNRLIVVVNGCKSAKARAREATRLLALGVKECAPIKIIEAGKPITEVSVICGEKATVALCTHEDVVIAIPKEYRRQLKVEAIMQEPVDAPVALGTKLGELVYKYGKVTSKKYDLFAVEPMERANFFQQAKVWLQRLTSGKESSKEVVKTPIGIKDTLRD